ncbi:MAG: hypothetical protein HC853_10870 [Anaerolineae bacterium]|nr:hypothetical protein [Anaerolineae bacterium]
MKHKKEKTLMQLKPSAFLRFVLLLCVPVLIQRPILAANVTPPSGTTVPEKNRDTTDDPRLVTNQVESTQFTQNISSRSGWQLTSLYVNKGNLFYVDYLNGTWTVDYRNYLYSGPEGYPAAVDNRVGYWSYCKNVYSSPYGTLLGAIGSWPILL